VQVTLTLAGQDADILLNYCNINIEDIMGKRSTQLKAPVSIIIMEKSSFGKCLTTQCRLTEIASLVC